MHRAHRFIACLFLIFCSGIASASDPFADALPGADPASALIVADDEFLPVELAYQLQPFIEQRDGKAILRLHWDIAEGYYLYRHGFRFVLTDEGTDITAEADIPKGKEKVEEVLGKVEIYYHNVDILLDDLPASGKFGLAVSSQGCAEDGICYPPYTERFSVDMQAATVDAAATEDNSSSPAAAEIPAADTTQAISSLPYMLLLAMLGGAILNLMPCVFPVLSLKVLGFANDKGHSPVIHGFTYTAGVVLSFVLVAALLVSLQAAGSAIGWGFHLQSPWFVGALCYLFFIMGLSLSGFLEIGSQWMNTGSSLAAKSGYSGSFFTGILATIVASPCTAPFMGTALGFAVTQPVAVALLVFAALGVGMALPVLILSCSPALLKHIPKPGPWMESLKQLLAFPLYATAIWLAWVVGNQAGVNGMAALLLGCLLLVIAIWYWRGRWFTRSLSAACLLVALAILASSVLKPAERSAADASGNKGWTAYSEARLQQQLSQGQPVFVNITADWCITCLTNEKVTLSTDRVKQAMTDNGITYLKGDWTNYDPAITKLLADYGRNGIPLYLVFSRDSSGPARVLPQILTVDTVVSALGEAAGNSDLASNDQSL